ncbi:hypothetical protein K1719_034830 [Acacia pycnantha]|nr:hypothetical protein K1719_034830 [Acacia pycnantha]
MATVKMTADRLNELGITMEDVSKYMKHMSTIRQCGRDGGSKYKTKEVYDEYEEAAKWKRENEAKEAKKRKRAAKKNADASVSNKKRKAHSEGWKPTESDHGSSEINNEEYDNVGEDKSKVKFYKKLKKVQLRPNVVPEAKADFNQSKLEDYDIRLMEMGALFGQVLDDKLGVMKAELQSMIEYHHVSAGTSAKAASKKDQGCQDSTPEEIGSSEHVDEVNSDDKSAHSEDDYAAKLSDNTPSDKPVEGDDGGSANRSEGETHATKDEEEDSSGSANGTEGEIDATKEDEEDSGGSANGSRGR